MDSKGILYLIPNKISEAPLDDVVPQRLVALVPTIKHYIVEDVRTVRRYLRQLNREVDIDSTTFYELNKHTIDTDITNYLDAAENGENI
ncbi:MAG: SAM-dependent methyltransferase, partial [Bacteroidales bacterium]|nr:SAM-dependent methyltransferase [Bacteroidales bacterium]